MFTHGPADDSAAVEVQDSGQIEPSLTGLDIGDIRDPGLVGSCGAGSLCQAVWGDGVVMVAVGCLDTVAGLLAASETLLAHDAGDAVASMPGALFAQLMHDTGAAVSQPALLMDLPDLAGQFLIFQSSGAGMDGTICPVVIAAGGDFKSVAQGADRVVGFHRVDPFEAVADGSERMPNVFFKMSLCSRRWRFSRLSSSRECCKSVMEGGLEVAAILGPNCFLQA